MYFQAKIIFAYVDSLIGIGSVYSLVFVALVYVALNRRNLFQAVLLILSCCLWTVILNTVYLMLLPVLNFVLELDMAAGSVNHNMTRVLLLLGTALMIVCTGEFLNFIFSPVDPEIGRSYDFGRFITAVWNNLLAGRPFVNETGQVVGRAPAKITSHVPVMPLRWVMAGILLVASVLPLISKNSFASISQDDVVALASTDMPLSIDDWITFTTRFQTHTFSGSDRQGFEKDTWIYQSPDISAEISIAEPFNMWFELPKLYYLQGWKTKQRQIATPADPSDPWQYVVSDMTYETGENQRVLFCYFDATGMPVTPPAKDSFAGRLTAATMDVQAPLFQVSVIHSHYNEMPPETEEAVTNLFLTFRQTIRDRVLRGETAAPEMEQASDATPPNPDPAP